jgi:hypothetical protein
MNPFQKVSMHTYQSLFDSNDCGLLLCLPSTVVNISTETVLLDSVSKGAFTSRQNYIYTNCLIITFMKRVLNRRNRRR